MSCVAFTAESCFKSNCDRTLCDRLMAFSATEPDLRIIDRSSALLKDVAPLVISRLLGLSSAAISSILRLYCIIPHNIQKEILPEPA
jgi:hypothetical protein